MELTKQQIINHRQRIRNSSKLLIPRNSNSNIGNLINLSPAIETPTKTHQIDLKTKTNLKKRKTSQDISVFEHRHKTKQIILSNNFNDLFQILEKLGEGTQSSVRKCKEKATGNIYAVKVFDSDTQVIDDLKVQYKILKTVAHQHIIQAHYLFVNPKENTSHMVIEYSQFLSLRKHLVKESILSEDETSIIISKLLIAIKHLHGKGVSHRDIKPDNLLYDQKTGNIKLIDFDISKVCKNKYTRIEMWTKTGTIQYCAPQMFAGGYSEMVDIWAVGVLTYEMLCGRYPFQIQYVNDAKKILQKQPQFPQSMSHFAINFIQRCLTKNPLKRPSAKQALTSPYLLKCEGIIPITPSASQKLNHSFDQQSTVSYHSSIKCFQDDEFTEQLMGDDIGIRCFTDQAFQ